MDNQTPKNNSLLDQIIASNKANINAQVTANPDTSPLGNVPEWGEQKPTPPQKPRDPMTTGMILKLIGTLFLVLIIFFGLFLSYIVFNPSEAWFFVRVFNVNPDDIATVLIWLLNGSFGFISFLLALVFMIGLFRTFSTPKEQKRKKLTLGLFSAFSGIIFFLILAFWAFLFGKIGNANFTNPNGNILLYDNELYNDAKTKPYAKILDSDNLIGPIQLRFNISDNAKRLGQQNGIKIQSFTFNPDGAECLGNIKGITDMQSDIICNFEREGKYEISGEYTIENLTSGTKKVETFPIKMDSITVKGLVNITKTENKAGRLTHIYDAKKLEFLGTPTWEVIDFSSGEGIGEGKIADAIYSVMPTSQPKYVNFSIDNSSGKSAYSRLYIIKNRDDNTVDGDIQIVQNPTNLREYIFTLTNTTIKPDDILSIDWKVNKISIECTNRSDSCSYIITDFGQKLIEANITLIGNKVVKVSKTFQALPPLLLERRMKVISKENKILNNDDTYDIKWKKYVIKGLTPPEKIILDARDVMPSDTGYSLTNVTWSIHDGTKAEEKTGAKIEIDLKKSARYTITGNYTFEKNTKTGREDDIRIVSDEVIIDMERKNINPVLKVSTDSLYVPTRVTVDASQSQSEYSDIVKFIFDFGDGRAPTEGDAVHMYTYTTAGEKTITVTAVDSNGEKAIAKEVLVLKDTPRSVDFTTSLSAAQVNLPVDFIAMDNSGQVEEYLWNFGDNTPMSMWYEVSHTFKNAGTYNVTLTIRYIDGTEKSTVKKFNVVEKIE